MVSCFPGALFHSETDFQAQLAFRFQVDRYNSQPSSIKLDLYEKAFDVADNFQLTRTGAIRLLLVHVLLCALENYTGHMNKSA